MHRRIVDGLYPIIVYEGGLVAKMYIGSWSDYETRIQEKLQPYLGKYRTIRKK